MLLLLLPLFVVTAPSALLFVVAAAAAAALYDFAAHLLLLKFARFSRLSNDGEAKAEVDALIVRSLSPSPPPKHTLVPPPCSLLFHIHM